MHLAKQLSYLEQVDEIYLISHWKKTEIEITSKETELAEMKA